jgi:hypothetical protein
MVESRTFCVRFLLLLLLPRTITYTLLLLLCPQLPSLPLPLLLPLLGNATTTALPPQILFYLLPPPFLRWPSSQRCNPPSTTLSSGGSSTTNIIGNPNTYVATPENSPAFGPLCDVGSHNPTTEHPPLHYPPDSLIHCNFYKTSQATPFEVSKQLARCANTCIMITFMPSFASHAT